MDDHIKHKYWTPQLIELTQIGCSEFDGGQPTPCFVDPRNIVSIVRGLGGFYLKSSDTLTTQAITPHAPCTAVMVVGSGIVHVIETPQEVALRRDRALEIPVNLKEVK